MTSPSVYISFDKVYANNACGKPVGRTHSGTILALQPDELSSVVGGYGTMYSTDAIDGYHSSPYYIAHSFTIADLNWPIPVSAYMNQPRCQYGPFQNCTIILDDYSPVLAVPPAVRDMDPVSINCKSV